MSTVWLDVDSYGCRFVHGKLLAAKTTKSAQGCPVPDCELETVWWAGHGDGMHPRYGEEVQRIALGRLLLEGLMPFDDQGSRRVRMLIERRIQG